MLVVVKLRATPNMGNAQLICIAEAVIRACTIKCNIPLPHPLYILTIWVAILVNTPKHLQILLVHYIVVCGVGETTRVLNVILIFLVVRLLNSLTTPMQTFAGIIGTLHIKS